MIAQCSKCGWRSYEVLRTHSYCINCNYFELDEEEEENYFELPIEPMAKAKQKKKPKSRPSKMLVIYKNDFKKAA